MTLYSTLDYTKQWMATELATAATQTADEQRLLQALHMVSMRVDSVFASRRPYFAPYIETYKPLITKFRVNSQLNTLALERYLLELTTDPSVNGTTITSEGFPDPLMPPFMTLRATSWSQNWYDFCTSLNDSAPLQASIPGIWGFHRDGLNAFQSVDTLAAAILTTTATTFTVADVDGGDVYGITPRISAGNLLEIEDEYLEVTKTDPATQTVTVRRGVNGSTAATHAITTPVKVWQVEEPVKQAVARQAAMHYTRRGSYTTTEAGGAAGVVEIKYPKDWLSEVMGMLQGYQYAGR